MLSRRLQRKGYEVVLALDGQSGVEMAQTQAPDLVLMDMSLPVLDGWEATRRLKADAATQHIPVIALTAHAMSSDREKALEAGCDDYDTKPVELPRLLAKIEALLSGERTGSRRRTIHCDRDHTSPTAKRPPPAAVGPDPRFAHASQSDHRLLRDADRTGAGARPGRLRPGSAENPSRGPATARADQRLTFIRSGRLGVSLASARRGALRPRPIESKTTEPLSEYASAGERPSADLRILVGGG